MENKKPQTPMSIEQAHNFIKSEKAEKDIVKDVKKQLEGAAITVAPEMDRKAFLLASISFLDTVSIEVENAFLEITGFIRSSVTRKEIAKRLRGILTCRTEGADYMAIGIACKMPWQQIISLEELAMIAVKESFLRHNIEGASVVAPN